MVAAVSGFDVAAAIVSAGVLDRDPERETEVREFAGLVTESGLLAAATAEAALLTGATGADDAVVVAAGTAGISVVAGGAVLASELWRPCATAVLPQTWWWFSQSLC